MLKVVALLGISIVILFVGVLVLIKQPRALKSSKTFNIENTTTTPPASPTSGMVTARFEIYTNGLLRSFRAPKYHNLSPDVIIQSTDPSTVIVKKTGVTWGDFFNTLPMKVTESCLTTGDGETLCASETSELTFELNQEVTPQVLTLPIKQNDYLKIIYAQNVQGASDSAQIASPSAQ